MPPAKTTPARKAAPRKPAVKQPAAKTTAGPSDPAAVYADLYPQGTDLWWYRTKNGTRIPFPRYSTIPAPPRPFWRRLYGLDEVFQAFEWMRYAKVPEAVQALTDALGDGEYQAMFEAWFSDADLTAGE